MPCSDEFGDSNCTKQLLGKMGGVTPCVDIQNCLCIVSISAWPPMCPLATSPCLSVLSICWVQYVVPGERCGCCFDAKPKGLSTATNLITNAMWTGYAMHDHNQSSFRDWLLQAVWLGSEWGEKFGAPRRTGSHLKTQENVKDGPSNACGIQTAIAAKGTNFRKYPFKNPQNAGPEFWGAGRGKGEFGSGSWWVL